MHIIVIINYLIAFLAIITMGYCIFSIYQLFIKVPGGIVKKRIKLLFALLLFFFAGYLISPLFYLLEHFEYTTLIVYLVFLFGAIFVLISIKTIDSILQFIGLSSKKEEE